MKRPHAGFQVRQYRPWKIWVGLLVVAGCLVAAHILGLNPGIKITLVRTGFVAQGHDLCTLPGYRIQFKQAARQAADYQLIAVQLRLGKYQRPGLKKCILLTTFTVIPQHGLAIGKPEINAVFGDDCR